MRQARQRDDDSGARAGAIATWTALAVPAPGADADAQKHAAASAAAALVQDGMRVGLGTGSTADWFVRELGARVAAGLRITTVATSQRTTRLAREVGIQVDDLDGRLDLAVDGADIIELRTLAAVKGHGGALTREKIVAAAADIFVIVADASKMCGALSERADLPLPVEVVPYGVGSTTRLLAAFGRPELRRTPDGSPLVTDNGNLILDLADVGYADPETLSAQLAATPGVVEHGLFIHLAQRAIIALADEVRDYHLTTAPARGM